MTFDTTKNGSYIQTVVFIRPAGKIHVTLAGRRIALVENDVGQLFSRSIPPRNVEADFIAAQLGRTLFNDAGLPVDDESLGPLDRSGVQSPLPDQTWN